MTETEVPPLTAQAANRALGLPENTVGVTIGWRFNNTRRRWEVRRLDADDRPVTEWAPVDSD